MIKIIFTLIVVICSLASTTAQTHYKNVKTDQEHQRSHYQKKSSHIHDPEFPDPQEESRALKKMQSRAVKIRKSERMARNKENLKYEKKRHKVDKYVRTYDHISRAGVQQHKRKLKEDRKQK